MVTKPCEYCDSGHCRDCSRTGRKGVNKCTYCTEGRCNVCKGSGREHIVEDR